MAPDRVRRHRERHHGAELQLHGPGEGQARQVRRGALHRRAHRVQRAARRQAQRRLPAVGQRDQGHDQPERGGSPGPAPVELLPERVLRLGVRLLPRSTSTRSGNGGAAGKIISQLYFRQAMQTLVDQPAIISKVFKGYGAPEYGPVPVLPVTNFLSSGEKTNPYPYSPTKAKKLLSSHGWKINPDGTDTCTNAGIGRQPVRRRHPEGHAAHVQHAVRHGHHDPDRGRQRRDLVVGVGRHPRQRDDVDLRHRHRQRHGLHPRPQLHVGVPGLGRKLGLLPRHLPDRRGALRHRGGGELRELQQPARPTPSSSRPTSPTRPSPTTRTSWRRTCRSSTCPTRCSR